MFKWLFYFYVCHISGRYQNKEKPLKRQRILGLKEHISLHVYEYWFEPETLLWVVL